MRILVTGASGFVGSALIRRLLADGHAVRALVRDLSRLGTLGAAVEVWRGDLLDEASLTGTCKGVDAVVHAAARVADWGTRRQFDAAIWHATERMLALAEGNAARFVYVSSVAALGLGRSLRGVLESEAPRQSGYFYADAKAKAEQAVQQAHERGRLACTTVRPGSITGPGSLWVREPLARMQSARGLSLIDGGRATMGFTYVDSVVDGIVRVLARTEANGQTFHFCDDPSITWGRYLTDLGALVKAEPRGSVPYAVAYAIASALELVCNPIHVRPPFTRMGVAVMGRDEAVDTQRARDVLGYRPTVSYDQAMARIASSLHGEAGRG